MSSAATEAIEAAVAASHVIEAVVKANAQLEAAVAALNASNAKLSARLAKVEAAATYNVRREMDNVKCDLGHLRGKINEFNTRVTMMERAAEEAKRKESKRCMWCGCGCHEDSDDDALIEDQRKEIDKLRSELKDAQGELAWRRAGWKHGPMAPDSKAGNNLTAQPPDNKAVSKAPAAGHLDSTTPLKCADDELGNEK